MSSLEMAGASGGTAAAGLLTSIASLELPGSATIGEAIGILRWRGQLDTAGLRAVAADVQASCSIDVIPDALLADAEKLTPARRADGAIDLGDYAGNRCTASRGDALVEFDRFARLVLMSCDDVSKVLDLTSGRVIRSASFDANAVFAAGRILYWTFKEVPASGLNAGGQEASLMSMTIDGGDKRALVTLPVSPTTVGSSVAVFGRRVLTSESVSGDRAAVVRDVLTGEELFRVPGSVGETSRALLPGLVHVGGRVSAVDMVSLTHLDLRVSTGDAVVADDAACVGRSRISDDQYLERGEDNQVRVVQRSIGRTAPATGGFVGPRFPEEGFEFIDEGGERRWLIDDRAISRWTIVAGRLYVQNTANQMVPVDLATGRETSDDPARLELAAAVLDEDARFDWLAGEALILRPNGTLRVVAVPDCATPSVAPPFAVP